MRSSSLRQRKNPGLRQGFLSITSNRYALPQLGMGIHPIRLQSAGVQLVLQSAGLQVFWVDCLAFFCFLGLLSDAKAPVDSAHSTAIMNILFI
jgi:hypothetical protein